MPLDRVLWARIEPVCIESAMDIERFCDEKRITKNLVYINLKINCTITREYFDPITVIIIDNVSIEHNAPYHSIGSMETEIID